MAVNKVVFGNQNLIDLTVDTVTPHFLLKDTTAYDKRGVLIVGVAELDEQGNKNITQPTNKQANKVVFNNQIVIDLTNATVSPTLLISGATAHDKSGKKITGQVTGIRRLFEFSFSNESISEDLIEFGEIIS